MLLLLQATTLAATSYTEPLAVKDTWLNQVVGCGSPQIADWTCGIACEKVPTLSRLVASNKSDETMALTVRLSNTECAVVFRGSKNIYNTLEDLKFFPKALPGCDGCKVHSGFHDDWKHLEPEVNAHLAKLGCGNGTVSVVGHSLGAAMGSLAAFDLAEAAAASSQHDGEGDSDTAPAPPKWRIGRVYTYGQPRTGNKAFAAAFDARLATLGVTHFRVVDYMDIVPHLPTANMLWEGWKHTGEEVYYNATKLGQYTICKLANDTRCSAQWGLLQTLTHGCDHCSYLGMNPCHCGKTTPDCGEPHH